MPRTPFARGGRGSRAAHALEHTTALGTHACTHDVPVSVDDSVGDLKSLSCSSLLCLTHSLSAADAGFSQCAVMFVWDYSPNDVLRELGGAHDRWG